jgi:Hemerythrin HHE cation binding domain
VAGNPFDLIEAHRALDDLLGRFLTAASAGELDAARQSIAEFDATLRRHMAHEEDRLYAPPPERKLVPPEEETDSARLSRELRLEHVQIRELSGMMLRLVVENGDLTGAQRLFGNLARRWDAHTAKEERSFAGDG